MHTSRLVLVVYECDQTIIHRLVYAHSVGMWASDHMLSDMLGQVHGQGHASGPEFQSTRIKCLECGPHVTRSVDLDGYVNSV